MTAVIWPKSKPEVEFQYGGRLGKFNGTLFQSHLLHCRVLPPSEFSDMSSQSHVSRCRVGVGLLPRWWIHCHDSRATLQSAVTWRNQCHDRATLQGVRIPSAILKIVFCHILFLSASLYVSKRGAYWDRLCRDVVGRWLSRACTVAKRCILGL